MCFRIYLVVFSFTHHGIGPSLPSLVPGGRPSTAPSSPLSSAPQSSMPLASSWRRLLPLGLSSPPLPRCTLPVLSQHTSRQGVDIDRQWAQEDVQILVSQSIVKYGSHIYVIYDLQPYIRGRLSVFLPPKKHGKIVQLCTLRAPCEYGCLALWALYAKDKSYCQDINPNRTHKGQKLAII